MFSLSDVAWPGPDWAVWLDAGRWIIVIFGCERPELTNERAVVLYEIGRGEGEKGGRRRREEKKEGGKGGLVGGLDRSDTTGQRGEGGLDCFYGVEGCLFELNSFLE